MAQQGSLPHAIVQFSEAVDKMSKTILVPRRLMDLPDDSLLKLPQRYHMNGDCSLKDENKMDVQEGSSKVQCFEAGLFGVFKMLLAVKEEVFTGKQSEVEGCFTNHIQAIVDTLQQMTVLAGQVTNYYCEVCENGAANGFNDFKLLQHGMKSDKADLKAYREGKMKLIL